MARATNHAAHHPNRAPHHTHRAAHTHHTHHTPRAAQRPGTIVVVWLAAACSACARLSHKAILPLILPLPLRLFDTPRARARAVFELDDFLYQAFLSRSRRDKFESSKPRATSPLSTLNPSGKQLIGYWCWLCFVLDIVMPLLAYFLQRLPKTNPSQTFGYEGITSCESSSSRATRLTPARLNCRTPRPRHSLKPPPPP